jgi:hypothetical protein
MSEQEFLSKIKRRLSQIAIGAPALRNQGAPGIVLTARSYCEALELDDFFKALPSEKEYLVYLDRHTIQLSGRFSVQGNWGAARKALNLFFRELVYNKFIADHYRLPTSLPAFNHQIQYLEVPLDLDVATGIFENSNPKPPKWDRIKRLNKEISAHYQQMASTIAAREGIAKIHLDLEYWRKNKGGGSTEPYQTAAPLTQ